MIPESELKKLREDTLRRYENSSDGVVKSALLEVEHRLHRVIDAIEVKKMRDRVAELERNVSSPPRHHGSTNHKSPQQHIPHETRGRSPSYRETYKRGGGLSRIMACLKEGEHLSPERDHLEGEWVEGWGGGWGGGEEEEEEDIAFSRDVATTARRHDDLAARLSHTDAYLEDQLRIVGDVLAEHGGPTPSYQRGGYASLKSRQRRAGETDTSPSFGVE